MPTSIAKPKRPAIQRVGLALALVGALAIFIPGLMALFKEAPIAAVKTLPYRIVRSVLHDQDAYTQGLLQHEGHLYESTGQYGASTLRKVDLDSGAVLQSIELDEALFGEGLARWQDRLIQLTWKAGIAKVWDLKTFEPKGEHRYAGEGWGLTATPEELVMSDGTAELRFLDPETFTERRRATVTHDGRPVAGLNELEWMRGTILANVWRSDLLLQIDPADGKVLGAFDLANLLPVVQRTGKEDVLNGVAYDPTRDRLYVTGKYWPRLFELQPKR